MCLSHCIMSGGTCHQSVPLMVIWSLITRWRWCARNFHWGVTHSPFLLRKCFVRNLSIQCKWPVAHYVSLLVLPCNDNLYLKKLLLLRRLPNDNFLIPSTFSDIIIWYLLLIVNNFAYLITDVKTNHQFRH